VKYSTIYFKGSVTGEHYHGRYANSISRYEGIFMTERKVDVMDKNSKVLHTYPITLSASSAPIGASSPWPRDADYEKAALSAAKTAKLVPESDFASLKTRMHPASQAAA
jgi:hypothetical protein